MRLLATVGIAAAVLLALAPGASAHAAETAVHSDPPALATQQSFEELACVPTCDVLMTPWANAPPVTVVESGAVVTWTAQVAASHTATSDEPADKVQLVQNEPVFADPCLDVTINSEADGQARLAIRDGRLAVLSQDQFDEPPSNQTWDVCEEAIGLEDGAFALSYHCNVHKQLQHSVLVVVPPA